MPVPVDPAKLKELRQAKGWSQDELAHRSKVAVKTIKRIEAQSVKRNCNSPVPDRLAAALGISVAELEITPRHLRTNVARSPEHARERAALLRSGEYFDALSTLQKMGCDLSGILYRDEIEMIVYDTETGEVSEIVPPPETKRR